MLKGREILQEILYRTRKRMWSVERMQVDLQSSPGRLPGVPYLGGVLTPWCTLLRESFHSPVYPSQGKF